MPTLRLPSTPEARAPVVTAVSAAISQSDPGFDAASLLREMPARYLAVRGAAAKADQARLRLYVSSRFLEQDGQLTLVQAERAQGSGDPSVEEVRLVWAERTPSEEHLVVGIDTLAMAGDDVHTLTEYWTLARQRGLQTSQVSAAQECPQCGAPVASGADICRYCETQLPGPLQHWLLDRVDTEIDWYEGPAELVV